jgi:hypothetical protein
MVTNQLRNVAKKAGPHGQVGTIEPVVLRETSRMLITALPWFIQRSSGEVETNLKLTQERQLGGLPSGEAVEITLKPSEVAALHEVLHDFLNLAGESEGDYLVVPLVPDPRRDSEDVAKKLLVILGQPGVPGELARLHLTPDVAAALHGAARMAELRAAVTALQGHLDSGDHLEAVYQTWCERHSWAFGNAYVARDEVRTVAVGDSVDLLMQSSVNGLRDVIELKRPNMPVLSWDTTHKCWHWTRDVTLAIAQCHRYLDVLHDQLRKGLRDHPEIVAYHPNAHIVIGRSADWPEAQQQGLHGLNARLHSITVMTYDHLLARAKAVLTALEEESDHSA